MPTTVPIPIILSMGKIQYTMNRIRDFSSFTTTFSWRYSWRYRLAAISPWLFNRPFYPPYPYPYPVPYPAPYPAPIPTPYPYTISSIPWLCRKSSTATLHSTRTVIAKKGKGVIPFHDSFHSSNKFIPS